MVDQWISDEWSTAFGGKVPFGDLRNQWRRLHCRTLNPYGSDTCPYASEQCIEAFRGVIESVLIAHPRVPVGYFIKVAKTTAAIRADEKPLARDMLKRATGRSETLAPPQGPGDPGDAARGADTGQPRVSGSQAGPISIGDLLGSLDPRPREHRGDEGNEGPE